MFGSSLRSLAATARTKALDEAGLGCGFTTTGSCASTQMSTLTAAVAIADGGTLEVVVSAESVVQIGKVAGSKSGSCFTGSRFRFG